MSRPADLTALLVDVGNTKVRVAGWSGGGQDLRRPDRGGSQGVAPAAPLPTLGTAPTPDPDVAAAQWRPFQQLHEDYPDLPVVVTSVVPHVRPLLQSLWPQLVAVGHESPLPFRMSLPDPAGIGPDRLCNVAAAAAAGLSRALVVDAGTATTIDLLLDGEFLGGLIAPGMETSLAGLTEKAARLPAVPFSRCTLAPGRDTVAAMKAGGFHVAVAGVEGVVRKLCREYPRVAVVLTGGLAGNLNVPGALRDPDWTLRGAAVISDVL